MEKIYIYTDGACSGNPGPGGYGAIVVYEDNYEEELSGGEGMTTNNRMEIMGIIVGLEHLGQPSDVVITTDSEYVCNTFNKGWINNWMKKNWKKSDGKPVLNRDLWEILLDAMEIHNVEFVHVKGHNGHHYNERCDRLAVYERDRH